MRLSYKSLIRERFLIINRIVINIVISLWLSASVFTLADELQGEVLVQKDVFLMKTTLTLLTISSLSLLLGIFADFNGSGFQKALAYFAGAIFWLCMLFAYLTLRSLSQRRKKYEQKHTDASYIKRQKYPGALTFFSNKWAAIADLILLIFAILILIILFVPSPSTVLTFIIAAIFACALQMHAVLNGINFKYILFISKKKER